MDDDSDYLAIEFANPPFVPMSDLALAKAGGRDE